MRLRYTRPALADLDSINAQPYPYLIFYENAGDEVVIHAVRHGARDPSGMPGAT